MRYSPNIPGGGAHRLVYAAPLQMGVLLQLRLTPGVRRRNLELPAGWPLSTLGSAHVVRMSPSTGAPWLPT